MFNLIVITILLTLVSCMPAPTELQFNSAAVVDTKQSIEVESELLVADREYVESVLLNAFDAKGTAEATKLEQLTLQKQEFGGPCDRYEASESGTAREFPRKLCFTGISHVSASIANPGRFALTMKACDTLIESKTRFSAIMAKIHGKSNTVLKPTPATITKAYSLFFIEQSPDSEVLNALQEISGSGRSPASTNVSAEDGWKRVITTLCVSPEWQII